MATAQTLEETSVCSICHGKLTNPIKLPGCLHKFCENCLLAYINNLRSDDKNLTEFQCPNCRIHVALPVLTDDLQTWIKSLKRLETNNDTMAANENSENATSGNTCIPCAGEDKAVLAEKLCIECQECLCARCSRIRHGPERLKEHLILDLRQSSEGVHNDAGKQENLSSELIELLKCSKHPSKTVSYLCRDEEMVCCIDCVTEHHKQCDTVLKLTDTYVKEDTKCEVKSVKEKAEFLVSQINLLSDVMKNDAAVAKRKSNDVIERIGEMKTQIITILDHVETNINLQAKAFAKKVSVESEETTKFNTISKRLQKHMMLIHYAENLGSSSIMSIVLKQVASKLDETQNDVHVVETANARSVHEIEIKTEPVLDSLFTLKPNEIYSIASLTETVTKIAFPGVKLSTHTSAEKLAEHAILPAESGCGSPLYFGIIYRTHKNGLFLVSKCHNFACTTDGDYKVTTWFNQETFSGQPYHAANLKNGVVAVSVPQTKKIYFLSDNESSELQITGNISTKYKPRAICGFRNGDIAVSYNDPVAFGVLQFTSMYTKDRVIFQHDTAGRVFKTFDFMAVDERRSHVIQPCTADKAVYCFDFEGNPKFKYSHEDLVKPSGVSISKDGNIFVCDQTKSVIHVISPYGTALNVVRDDVPKKPLGIAFDTSGLQFAVTQRETPWKVVCFFRLQPLA